MDFGFSLATFNKYKIKMRNTTYHHVKTLIDLEPHTTKYRSSAKIEELFRSTHKKTRSESSGCSSPKSAGLFTAFQTALNSKPQTERKKIVLQSRPHSRKNSERDNKENVRMSTCQR